MSKTTSIHDTKSSYLSDNDVQAFIQWAFPKLDQPGSLNHTHVSRRTKKVFRCDSLYSAYQNYKWTASFTRPDGRRYSGTSREDNEDALRFLASTLRGSVNKGDVDLCLRTCIAIQEWGGTRRNIGRLNEIGPEIVNYLLDARERLNPETYVTGLKKNRDIHMTSGFSKIYSFLMDDFVIYDSRVAAALAMLIREFCVETGLCSVPDRLRFSMTAARSEANRDPSCEKYSFPMMQYYGTRYLDNNIKANWLLRSWLDYGDNKFLEFPRGEQVLTLGNALFMVGYEIPKGVTPTQLPGPG